MLETDSAAAAAQVAKTEAAEQIEDDGPDFSPRSFIDAFKAAAKEAGLDFPELVSIFEASLAEETAAAELAAAQDREGRKGRTGREGRNVSFAEPLTADALHGDNRDVIIVNGEGLANELGCRDYVNEQ